MSYQFWSSVEMWSFPAIIWVAAVGAMFRRRRYRRMLCAIHDAPPGQLPEPPPRISWSQGMLIMFCLLPLRLVAGRRPLLGTASRRGRPMTAKQVSALELQLGLREPENPIEEFDDPRLSVREQEQHPITDYAALHDALRRVVVDSSDDPDPVMRALRNRRNRLWANLKALADEAAADGRTFTAEEHVLWEEQNEHMDVLDRHIKSILDMRDRVRAAAGTPPAAIGNGRGCLSNCTDPTHVVNIRAIGDRHDVWIAATPEHQEYMLQREAAEYERGRDAGHDLIRRLGDPDA